MVASPLQRGVSSCVASRRAKERTGSYIGLFQLSDNFKQYGSETITDPRDNAVAAAYKFAGSG
jgi:hypothetical protein